MIPAPRPVPALLAALLACGLAHAPAGATPDAPAALCHEAARMAAAETGVPEAVLVALTLTETGRDTGSGLEPWPWALNLGGPGVWADSRAAALARLEDEVASGRRNIDVGCFQINLGWHAGAFASAEEMIDPVSNARYAARLVQGHFRRTGNWTAAAAAYHSRTPDLAARYLARFEPILAAVEDGNRPDLPAGTPAAEDLPNGYPLLVAGAAASRGSLVPATSARRPLFGAP
jgi:hypothetical protein